MGLLLSLLRALLLAVFSLASIGSISAVETAQGPTCDWFMFQEYAQLTFDKSPIWDGAAALDPDGDGIACPELTHLLDAGMRRSTPPEGAVETAVVSKIVDGDTIHVRLDTSGQDHSVREISVNAPERDECYGSNATKAVRRLVPVGTPVWLQRIDRDTDKNDRLLRHIWYAADDGTYRMLEHETTMRGFTFAKDYGDGSPYMPYIADAMRAANIGEFGVWAKCDDLPAPADLADVTALSEGRATVLPLTGPLLLAQQPEPAPAATQAPIGIGGNCDPSYPTVCIPPAPPDLDCPDIPYRQFQVVPPDPHRFDGNHDGVGCESS